MNYLEQWRSNIFARSAVPLPKSAQAVGSHDKHTGPSWQFAVVELRAEPAESFGVIFDLPAEQIEVMQHDGWLDEIVFGALDVLMTSKTSPILGITLHVIAVKYDPARSSRVAFRLASRNAAANLLKASTLP